MEFYGTKDGNKQYVGNVGKLVIYGGGRILFEREQSMDVYDIKEKDGERVLSSVYAGAPEIVVLPGEVKNARKENLTRTDNYTLSYTPEYFRWEKRIALYVHESNISVQDMGEVLALETKDQKSYLHAYKLTLHGSTTFKKLHVEKLPAEGFTLPDGGRFSDCYGTADAPCFELCDYTDSEHERLRARGRFVMKRWTTLETIAEAEIIATAHYYTRTIYSEDRKRKDAIAEKINASGVFREKWSYYDVERIEKALGYTIH